MAEQNSDLTFFGFRMIDKNENEISLSQFQEKDLVIIVNCRTVDECDFKAPLYAKLEDNFEKRVQILCIPGSRFFYEGRQNDESLRLISFLKEKTNCKAHVDEEDGLVFVVDNKAHKTGKEVITYLGSNLNQNQVSDALTKHLN